MPNHLDLIIEGSPLASKVARKRLRQALEEWGLPFTIPCEELLIAVGEAASNAFRHGCNSLPKPIRVLASYDPTSNSIAVEISDTGPGFDTSKPLRVEPFADLFCCGRFIMAKCVDQVSYDTRDGWFVCRLIKIL